MRLLVLLGIVLAELVLLVDERLDPGEDLAGRPRPARMPPHGAGATNLPTVDFLLIAGLP